MNRKNIKPEVCDTNMADFVKQNEVLEYII